MPWATWDKKPKLLALSPFASPHFLKPSSGSLQRVEREYTRSQTVEQKSRSSDNSGVAELKEDGQVSCDAAHNPRLTCLYIAPHARAAAAPASASSTPLAFSCGISV